MASGQQIRRAAYRVREPAGPQGCQLPARGRADQETPGSHSGTAAAADRLRRELRRSGRSAAHEGHLLERWRSGHDLPRGRDSRGHGRAGSAVPGKPGRGRCRSQRRADEQVPGRGRPVSGRDQGRPASAYPGQRDRSGCLRLLVPAQGCASGDLGMTFREEEIPEDMAELAQQYRENLVEAAAEANEELMNKYLEEGDLSLEEIKAGLRQRTLASEIVPAVCGSSFKNKGVPL